MGAEAEVILKLLNVVGKLAEYVEQLSFPSEYEPGGPNWYQDELREQFRAAITDELKQIKAKLESV